MLTITFRTQYKSAIVDLDGKLTSLAVKQLKRTLNAFFLQNTSHTVSQLIINLAEVPLITSKGLSLFITTLQYLRTEKGITVTFINPQPAVLELFEITRLCNIFDIFDNETDALQL